MFISNAHVAEKKTALCHSCWSNMIQKLSTHNSGTTTILLLWNEQCWKSLNWDKIWVFFVKISLFKILYSIHMRTKWPQTKHYDANFILIKYAHVPTDNLLHTGAKKLRKSSNWIVNIPYHSRIIGILIFLNEEFCIIFFLPFSTLLELPWKVPPILATKRSLSWTYCM